MEKSGLPLKRFFNTSGNIYKEMKLKDKLPEMSEEEATCASCNRRDACETTNPCWERQGAGGVKKKEWEEYLKS